MSYFLIVYLFLVLFILIRRFVQCPTGSLSNPLFYIVGFGALYFLLPASYLDFILIVAGLTVKESTIVECQWFSIWYETVFLIFYLFSNDYRLRFNTTKANEAVVNVCWWLNVIFCVFLLFVLIIYVPKIFALRADRGAAFELYEYSINSPFRFRQITYCHIAIMFVLVWAKRRLIYLLPCIAYLIIDYSHGGRTSSLIILLFVYFCFILVKRKTYIKYAVISIVFLTAVGLFQRSDSSKFSELAFTSGMEFSNTYITTAYLVEHPEFKLDPLEYIVVSIMRLFPGGIIDKMTGFIWYGDLLSEKVGLGYGLAGNLITEALVYGGKFFAIINPILIGTILFIINEMSLKKTLVGILSVLLLSFTMQITIRQYFWGFILYPLQIILFYCIWAFPDFRKRIFV